ncbi:MAG TPA: hypothetical protein VGL27_17550 [Negativicutes bacterium]|jgi:hypothetical protein
MNKITLLYRAISAINTKENSIWVPQVSQRNINPETELSFVTGGITYAS